MRVRRDDPLSGPAEVIGGRLLAGRYRLTERIDRGGTAEVWRARDERLDRDVAVKILGAEADEAFRERFTDEARRAASVSHPNIVAVYDEGRDGADAFIVMEEVRGRSLRDIAADRGALPDREALAILRQIADALDATHRAGLVHCDVKPANVIVDGSGNAKLTDFGIARAARDTEERELVGTARYIAPERIEGRPPTARSDVYGLALIAYELLAGRPAFAGVESEDVLRDRLASGAPALRRIRPDLPPGVDAAIAKGLARDPARRYPTAGGFALALADGFGGAGRPDTRVLRPLPRPRPRRWRWPRLDGILALGLLLALLLGVVLFFVRFPAGTAGPPGAAPSAPAARNTPDVVGRDRDEAARILIAAGFRSPVPWVIDAQAKGKPCTVVRQEPAANTTFEPGTAARLVVTAGKCGGKD